MMAADAETMFPDSSLLISERNSVKSFSLKKTPLLETKLHVIISSLKCKALRVSKLLVKMGSNVYESKTYFAIKYQCTTDQEDIRMFAVYV